MYKLAEKKLMEELEKLKNEFKPKNEELEDITEKLKSITTYDNLQNDNFSNFGVGFLGLICGILLSGCAIAVVIYFFKTLSFNIWLGLLGTGLGALGIFCTCGAKVLLSDFISNHKEIKELKQKGIKKLKKEEAILLTKKEELGKEKELNQDKINEINRVLEHINFYNETVNDYFYQADNEEEYDLGLETNGDYEQLFEEYLNEEASYSNVHFDSIPSEITLSDEMSLRKIYK